MTQTGPYMSRKKIVLASGSPRRRELLANLGLDFEVIPSAATEPAPERDETPAAYAERMAELKAHDIAAHHPDAVVIGSDTVVAVDGHILGKPQDDEDALRMLRMLSGKVHEVVTGVSVILAAGSDGGARGQEYRIAQELVTIQGAEKRQDANTSPEVKKSQEAKKGQDANKGQDAKKEQNANKGQDVNKSLGLKNGLETKIGLEATIGQEAKGSPKTKGAADPVADHRAKDTGKAHTEQAHTNHGPSSNTSDQPEREHHTFHASTSVTMRTSQDAELRAYIATGEPSDKAGAYAIQGIGTFLVTEISGSYTNVVGLPLARVLGVLLDGGVVVARQG